MSWTEKSSSSKVSAEFSDRLNSLPPNRKLHAVVLVNTDASGEKTSQRQSRAERRVKLDELREAARSVLKKVDAVLEECGGRRLDKDVTALGTVAVEATPAGIEALARLKNVKTVFEDQPVSLLGGV